MNQQAKQLLGIGAPDTNGRTTPRRIGFVALAAVAALLLSSCFSASQNKGMNLVNSTRASYGKQALTGDSSAMSKAQAWSEHMARTGVLEHTGGGSSVDTSGISGWCSLGENVGYGPTMAAVNNGFVNSSTHRANLLGNYDKVGIGVVRSGDRVWITQIFYRSC